VTELNRKAAIVKRPKIFRRLIPAPQVPGARINAADFQRLKRLLLDELELRLRVSSSVCRVSLRA